MDRRNNKYHFANDMNQWSELATDVEEVENANDEYGDDETVEDASVRHQSRNHADREAGEEENDDDRVDYVPHVRVEHAQLLAAFRRLADEELTQRHGTIPSTTVHRVKYQIVQ